MIWKIACVAWSGEVQELTNFSGSSGAVIWSADKTYLLVDGRYSAQATQEVFPYVEIFDYQKISIFDFFRLLPANDAKLSEFVIYAHTIDDDELGISIKAFILGLNDGLVSFYRRDLDDDLIEKSVRLVGSNHLVSISQKLLRVREMIKEEYCDSYFSGSPSDNSWLLSIRDFCVPFDLDVRSWLLVTANAIVLFVSKRYRDIIYDISATTAVLRI